MHPTGTCNTLALSVSPPSPLGSGFVFFVSVNINWSTNCIPDVSLHLVTGGIIIFVKGDDNEVGIIVLLIFFILMIPLKKEEKKEA